MKGVIVVALKGLVVEKFGKEAWLNSLKKAGIETEPSIVPLSDVDDQTCMNVIKGVCETAHLTLTQAADAFGDYWVNVYAPKLYSSLYYQGVNGAREFLLKMDTVHMRTTQMIPNAHPPRFEYEWLDDKTLIMKYKSSRGMIDFLVGLVKGVGKYYKENLLVSKASNDSVKVVFLS